MLVPSQYTWWRAEKKKTIRCSNDVSILLQYPWKRADKEEKKVQPNLCTIHAKCVTIIPKDIQLACNISGKDLITHPKPKMNYRAWLWMTTIQQMKPSSSLLKITSSLLIMRLKDKSKRERRQHHKDEFYAFYLKKNMNSLLGMN